MAEQDAVDELEKELNETNVDEWDEAAWDRKMERVNNASNVLGKYLLQGWTMLGDHCPICASPLMSLRGAEPKCVVCDQSSTSQSQS